MTFVIGDGLTNLKRFEFTAFHYRMVEEDVTLISTDESKTFFRNELFNGPLRHLATLQKIGA